MSRKHFSAMMRDRAGNFGLAFAIAVVPVMVALGCSLDYVRAVNTHRKMQSDLDAALVAAVNSVGTKDETAIKTQIANWIEAEAEQKQYYVLNTSGIQIDTTNSTIKASVTATVPTTFLKIAGINTVPVAVSSSVIGGNTVTKTAFSMYLVLDRSGSMADATNTTYTTTCYTNETKKTGAYICTKTYSKIEALKLATDSLMTQLSTADPNKIYVRTAAVSYNQNMQTPTGFAWGEDAALTYVKALTATGNTDSSDAMATALAALTKTGTSGETNIHKAKTGLTPDKYIVFMTDGANNVANADTETKATCDSARTAGVRIYTIAFMAPTQGQNLLKYCATNAGDYFAAENTADLVSAFKTIGETSSKNLIRLTQ